LRVKVDLMWRAARWFLWVRRWCDKVDAVTAETGISCRRSVTVPVQVDCSFRSCSMASRMGLGGCWFRASAIWAAFFG